MISLRNYAFVREVVINLGSLSEILALYVAYLLGADKWVWGISVLVFCLVLNNILSRGWLWLIRTK